LQLREVNAGAVRREVREKVLEAARRREIDAVLVCRLDQSATNLPASLRETGESECPFRFSDRGEAGPDSTAGRAMAGVLEIFFNFDEKSRGTNPGQAGTCAGEGKTVWVAGNHGGICCQNQVAALCWRPANPNRPALGGQAHLVWADFGLLA
jgi:hypothetical protein